MVLLSRGLMLKKSFLLLPCLVLFVGCGLFDDNSCQGTLYRTPSLYTGAGGTIYVSYYVKDKSVDSDGTCVDNTANYSLVFAQSADDGASWTKKIIASEVLPSDTTELMSQSLAVNTAGYIFITYVNLDKQLVVSVSKDSGLTFYPTNLETYYGVRGNSIMTDYNGNVYVAYNTYSTSDPTDTSSVMLRVIKYSGGTGTWGTATTIDSTANTGFAPSLTVTGNNKIFISYYYRGAANSAGLEYARSDDSGATWTTGDIKAADGSVSGPLSWIISDTNNYLYVGYYDPAGYTGSNSNWKEKDTGTYHIAKSTDYGLTWTTNTIDSDADTGKSNTLVPGMGGTNVNVCYGKLINYTALDSTDNQILCSQSTDGGTLFSTPTVVDTGSTMDINVAGLTYLNMAMDFYNSSLYLVYSVTNSDGTTNLKLAKSTDGITWTKTNVY